MIQVIENERCLIAYIQQKAVEQHTAMEILFLLSTSLAQSLQQVKSLHQNQWVKFPQEFSAMWMGTGCLNALLDAENILHISFCHW